MKAIRRFLKGRIITIGSALVLVAIVFGIIQGFDILSNSQSEPSLNGDVVVEYFLADEVEAWNPTGTVNVNCSSNPPSWSVSVTAPASEGDWDLVRTWAEPESGTANPATGTAYAEFHNRVTGADTTLSRGFNKSWSCPKPPTATPQQPTLTPVPPTETPVPPTATPEYCMCDEMDEEWTEVGRDEEWTFDPKSGKYFKNVYYEKYDKNFPTHVCDTWTDQIWWTPPTETPTTPPTITSTVEIPTLTFTPSPTWTPNPTLTDVPGQPAQPASTEVKFMGICPNHPYLRDIEKEGERIVEWRDATTTDLPLVRYFFTDTPYWDFRNPTVGWNMCFFGVQAISKVDGKVEFRVYDFGGNLIRRHPGYVMPELPLIEDSRQAVVTNNETGELVSIDIWNGQTVSLRTSGDNPITLTTQSGTYVGYSNADQDLEVLTPSGEVKQIGEDCQRPDADVLKKAFACRQDGRVVLYYVESGKVEIIDQTWSAAAINPEDSDQIALTGNGLVVWEDGSIIEDVSNDPSYGGSDWGGTLPENLAYQMSFWQKPPTATPTNTRVPSPTPTATLTATPATTMPPATDESEGFSYEAFNRWTQGSLGVYGWQAILYTFLFGLIVVLLVLTIRKIQYVFATLAAHDQQLNMHTRALVDMNAKVHYDADEYRNWLEGRGPEPQPILDEDVTEA